MLANRATFATNHSKKLSVSNEESGCFWPLNANETVASVREIDLTIPILSWSMCLQFDDAKTRGEKLNKNWK